MADLPAALKAGPGPGKARADERGVIALYRGELGAVVSGASAGSGVGDLHRAAIHLDGDSLCAAVPGDAFQVAGCRGGENVVAGGRGLRGAAGYADEGGHGDGASAGSRAGLAGDGDTTAGGPETLAGATAPASG
ncbi:MAG: hypothetical protein ACK55I_27220, partial [bacterium]